MNHTNCQFLGEQQEDPMFCLDEQAYVIGFSIVTIARFGIDL